MTTSHAGAHPAGTTTASTASRTAMPIRDGAYRVVAIVTLAMLLLGGFALLPRAASAQSTTQVLDDLNLRSDPALNSAILDVMPTGATVEITGDPVDGFYPVAYNGQTGYAYGFYLGYASGNGYVVTGGQQGEVIVAAGPVNFRTGPSTDDAVLAVIPAGGLVALTGDAANGFLSLIYNDMSGWAYGDSVLGTNTGTPPAPEAPSAPVEEPPAPDGVPVGDIVTGAASIVDGALNLRTGPGTGYPVITVMPGDASVELRGDPLDGFYPVAFNGQAGWASASFLQIGGPAPADPPVDPPAVPEVPDVPAPQEPPAPVEPPAPAPTEPAQPGVDGSDGYSEDEIIQIIYAAADAYGQPREDMLRVARCESVLDPNAVNPASNASGLFQFLPSTWATTPYADQDIFDPVANANAAGWMWSVGRRNEWTCQ